LSGSSPASANCGTQQPLASISPISPCFDVMPARAGTHEPVCWVRRPWVPAFAGMTVCGVGSERT
jgi:hypothetical protein